MRSSCLRFLPLGWFAIVAALAALAVSPGAAASTQHGSSPAPARPAPAPPPPPRPSGNSGRPPAPRPQSGYPQRPQQSYPQRQPQLPQQRQPVFQYPNQRRPVQPPTQQPPASFTRPNRPISVPGDRVVNRPNGQAIYGKNNSLRAWSGNGMSFTHGSGGARIVNANGPGNSHIQVLPRGGGWVEHPFSYRGAEFGRRTITVHGAVYDRFYRHGWYRGVPISIYTPVRYYPSAFYFWAARPWGVSLSFSWGWGGSPWYGYYGAAFAPYPYYSEPSTWLTDYVLADSMNAAYQQGYADNAAGPAPDPVNPLSPEAKQQIDEEVQRQVAALDRERQLQNGPRPPDSGSVSEVLASNKPHTFVAGTAINVVDSTGTQCTLTPGDSVRFTPPPPDTNAVAVDVTVMWGKNKQDCQAGGRVTIAVQDLQEMENYMRATVDQGLDRLRTEQARGAIPPAPAPANGAPTSSSFLNAAPQPDTNVQTEVENQSSQADLVEKGAGTP